MVKKRSESLQHVKQARRNAKPIRNKAINFSDLPESTDAELSRARRVGRPKTGNAKELIAIRIAPSLLSDLRRMAAKKEKPYQTLIHELLEKAARRSRVA
jgi:predicted DNA binding CopG/RHH family protein